LGQNVAPGCDTLSLHSNPYGSNLCIYLIAIVEIGVLLFWKRKSCDENLKFVRIWQA
jgi:hypothetical protein